MKSSTVFKCLIILGYFLAGCAGPTNALGPSPSATPENQLQPDPSSTPIIDPVPGELVDYVVQSGDTLSAVAAHFNTTTDEIIQANPGFPTDMTTLPPGLPLTIPAYFLPLTGSSFQVIPDSEVVYGPSAVEFDLAGEISARPGFLNSMSDYLYKHTRPAWEVVELVASEYSIHPRLLLTLLEFQTNALTNPTPEAFLQEFPLGIEDQLLRGLYWQLSWAAGKVNDGYYGWRTGVLEEFSLADGYILRPNSWQNAGTIGLYSLFSELYGLDDLTLIMSPDGFQKTYRDLWGDPFAYEIETIPANLQQPEVGLPFEPGIIWDYSAGPHFSWGSSLPLGALDFAPPAVEGGCAQSEVWIASPAVGRVVRSENSTVVLELDEDNDERTGWMLLFFHVEERDRISPDLPVQPGDKLGHPSCEGGRATGTHFHTARRYNGEWLPAAGTLPFVLDGWVVEYGDEPYLGTMIKGSITVEACTCTTSANRIIYEFP
ncbi:MAG: LysM domain-containing protein [Anaerolineales bacterium]